MEGSFYRQVEDEVMRKVDERLSDEADRFNKTISNLRTRTLGYVITAGLVASLIGIGSGILNHRKISELEGKIDENKYTTNNEMLDSVTIKEIDGKTYPGIGLLPDNPILPNDITESTTSDNSISSPSKGLNNEVMEDSNGKMLIQPIPVPGSTKQLESSLEEY